MRSPGFSQSTPSPDFDHLAGSFAARNQRQAVRRRVEAAAVIDVEEIEADRRVADQHLAGAGPAGIVVLIGQRFRTAVGVDLDGFGHGQDFSGSGFAPRFGNSCMMPPMQNR